MYCLPTKSLSLAYSENLGDLIEKFDSQPDNLYMLSKVNSFKLTKSSHEYQSMTFWPVPLYNPFRQVQYVLEF